MYAYSGGQDDHYAKGEREGPSGVAAQGALYIYVCMYVYTCICIYIYIRICMHIAGVKTIIMPKANEKDLRELPPKVNYICMYVYTCIFIYIYSGMYAYSGGQDDDYAKGEREGPPGAAA